MINIQNIDDNECFNWCLVKYISSVDPNPKWISKVNKDIGKKLDFKDIWFPIKIRDIHKIGKKNSIDITVFGYENKENIQSMYQKNVMKKKHTDLLLVGEKGKRHYVVIKDFNNFMYDHTLHHVKRFSLLLFKTF